MDCDSLKTYFDQLTHEDIEESVSLLEVASPLERLELISSDCIKYISIISNYKDKNLQTLCNVIIRRIGGHLQIKFRVESTDRWEEVGFYDKDNTDTETLQELQRLLTVYVNHYDKIKSQELQHIASQTTDGDEQQPQNIISSLMGYVDDSIKPHNEYESTTFDDPSLQPTDTQRKSAGYEKLPENHLKSIQKQPEIKPLGASDKCSTKILLSQLSDKVIQLRNSPLSKHPSICNSITDLISKQPPHVLAELLISLIDE